MERVSRKNLSLKICESYFSDENKEFSHDAFIRIFKSHLFFLEQDGEVFKDGKINEDRVWKYKYEETDHEKLIEDAIRDQKISDELDKKRTEENQNKSEIVKTRFDGKKYYPLEYPTLPVPTDELYGELFFSETHFIQFINVNGSQATYLRDTQNINFIRKLYRENRKFDPGNGLNEIEFTLIGATFNDIPITVGIFAHGKWEFSLLHDGPHEWDDLTDTQKRFLLSAETPDIEAIMESAERADKEKRLKDLEQRGHNVVNQELFEAMGSEPNALTDDEYEMVFGTPRD